MNNKLLAGASAVDITPRKSMFLYGYPHVPRYSTGTNDPLLGTALYLESGSQRVLFISADLVFVTKSSTRNIRQRIERETGIPQGNILIGATHTHSGPMTVDNLCASADPIVPKTDPEYVREFEDHLVAAGIEAWRTRGEAELSVTIADATGVGTSRHNPKGLSDLNVPVICVRDASTHEPIGLMMVCGMHPTVLHEDSTLYSGDFPAYARTYLQQEVLKKPCPIVYLTGPSGDQSPRHVTRANTFAEAERLGHILGRAVEKSLANASYSSNVVLASAQAFTDLPKRKMPTVTEAEQAERAAHDRLTSLQKSEAARTSVRTAECDWFGAEETFTLSRAAQDGRLEQLLKSTLPAEVQLLRVGQHSFISWPGEFFVAFALDVTKRFPNAHIITMANGELQGYVVTQQAVDQKWYEATNATLQSPDAGNIIVEQTLKLLKEHAHGG